jgi:nucleotide-binding universal stress UspA family protein
MWPSIFLKTYGETCGPLLADMQQELDEAARKQLDELLIDSDGSGPPTRRAVLTSVSPFSTIVGYAADNDIDLIVMGTHGRGGFAHLMMGSVAERVVRLAPCPVLTVRHPEHEFVRPDTLATVAHAQAIGA